MAYRFLLEVPESLGAEANVAIGTAEDAQVVVVRDSGARDFDEPYLDLTVAAHTLRVIDTLYDWFDTLGASRPDIRLVLHSGERLSLEAHDRGSLVAAIRGDQPWVERTIPRIGDHVDDLTDLDDDARGDPVLPPVPAVTRAAGEVTRAASALAVADEERTVAIRELNHIALRVTDLAKAERFYTEFLAMDLLGRARHSAQGGYVALNGSYSWDEATRTGQEADVSFLRNGPLTLALQRLGRGARLERGFLDHISVRVDATTFTALKGQVLMRSYELLATSETAFAFRDPFGITWEFTLQGSTSVM
jgi:catechol 2,3-dioxygenase-like lactoylglutathione lyase family enzyme